MLLGPAGPGRGRLNRTVSREQARILWDGESSEYRLHTEPGASGTRILREGRTIDVSAQDRRGVRLLTGDEVYLGKACLKWRSGRAREARDDVVEEHAAPWYSFSAR